MPNWGKIIVLYSLAVAAAFGRLAFAGTETVSVAEINLKGDYANRPLIADVYADLSDTNFSTTWAQLAALKYTRFLAVGKNEAKMSGELAQLRTEHRALMMNRNGTGQMDDSVERSSGNSSWAMAVTHNISRQADLRARLSKSAGRWDAANSLSVRYRMSRGKKILVRFETRTEQVARK